MEVSGQVHAPAALTPPPPGEKIPMLQINKGLGRFQSKSGCFIKEKSLLALFKKEQFLHIPQSV
jgi:hypothetical protein